MIMDDLQERHEDDLTTMKDDDVQGLLDESASITKEEADKEKNTSWAQIAAIICAKIP